MDLRKYNQNISSLISEKELLSLWWYQPFIFSESIISGAAPSAFMKGMKKTIVERNIDKDVFTRFQHFSNCMISTYEDWLRALIQEINFNGQHLHATSVFELACNTGYFLMRLREEGGAGKYVGIDKADLSVQRSLLKKITGINDIEYRPGKWLADSHLIEGLSSDEQYDVVICNSFIEHISNPLNLINELAKRTRRIMLLNVSVGYFQHGFQIKYKHMPHHDKWGDQFPYFFDTRISRKLLLYSLEKCGFKKVAEVKNFRLPLRWSFRSLRYMTLICVK